MADYDIKDAEEDPFSSARTISSTWQLVAMIVAVNRKRIYSSNGKGKIAVVIVMDIETILLAAISEFPTNRARGTQRVD
jgi:hypothetical protein